MTIQPEAKNYVCVYLSREALFLVRERYKPTLLEKDTNLPTLLVKGTKPTCKPFVEDVNPYCFYTSYELEAYHVSTMSVLLNSPQKPSRLGSSNFLLIMILLASYFFFYRKWRPSVLC